MVDEQFIRIRGLLRCLRVSATMYFQLELQSVDFITFIFCKWKAEYTET